MRALCGAIIAAGALIGLGLSAIGFGIRYQSYGYHVQNPAEWVHFRQIDTPLMIVIVALLIALFIGLCIAFIGLAYHQHRRHLEIVRHQARGEE
jgi:hypothetical protein